MSVRTALIIEDNHSVGDIVSRVFKMQSVAAEIISDGNEALDYLTETAPDIIFLDMGLADFNTNLILEFAYAQSHLSDSIVIILSNNRALSKIGLERIDFILRKPLDIQQLNYIVNQVVPKDNPNLIRHTGS